MVSLLGESFREMEHSLQKLSPAGKQQPIPEGLRNGAAYLELQVKMFLKGEM
jgi:hypothetical protein